jgi:hypothetical protein
MFAANILHCLTSANEFGYGDVNVTGTCPSVIV